MWVWMWSERSEVNGGRIVDKMLGSFNNHVADGSVNLAIKMNSHFLSYWKRCDVYVSVVVCLRPPQNVTKAIFHVEGVLVRQWIVPKGLLHV